MWYKFVLFSKLDFTIMSSTDPQPSVSCDEHQQVYKTKDIITKSKHIGYKNTQKCFVENKSHYLKWVRYTHYNNLWTWS